MEMSPAKHLSAPKITHNTEKCKYRKAVRVWAQHVRISANGGSNSSKFIARGMCYNLYATINCSFEQIIDRSPNLGGLQFFNENHTPLAQVFQKETREKLLSIVPNVLATASVHRLVNMSREVYTWKKTNHSRHRRKDSVDTSGSTSRIATHQALSRISRIYGRMRN